MCVTGRSLSTICLEDGLMQLSITKADMDSDNDLDASGLSKQKVFGKLVLLRTRNKTTVG